MGKFSDYVNKHKDQKAIILGCGISAPIINTMDLTNIITIGVNDIELIFTPTYLMIVDYPSRFKDDRKNRIANSRAKFVLTHVIPWKINNDKKVLFELGNRHMEHLDIKRFPNKIDFSNNSPYMSIIAAYKMGCKKIGLLGVDFTDNHFYANDGQHNLIENRRFDTIINDFNLLRDALKKEGVEIYNLSEVSLVTSFPKIKPEEF